MKLLSTKNLQRGGLVIFFTVLFLCVFFGVGALINPIGYNYLMTYIQEHTGVNLSLVMADEPSIQVGACTLRDGDMLYYDSAKKEWVTSNACYPAFVEEDGESFVSLKSESLYQFNLMEAPNYTSNFSSMTIAPFCAAVIIIGDEDISSGVELHYGCETEIGVEGFSAFSVEYQPVFDFID